jgi:hypothetical protein
MRRVLTYFTMAVVTLMSSAVLAQAQTLTFTAQLSGSNEAPPVAATGAGGDATVTLNLTTRTGTYVVNCYNFPSGVSVSHIHAGGPGVSGPVVVNFSPPAPASNDFAFSGTFGASDVIARAPQGVNSWDDLVQAIMTGHAYVNVHSQVNPSGEIRGQLVLKQ